MGDARGSVDEVHDLTILCSRKGFVHRCGELDQHLCIADACLWPRPEEEHLSTTMMPRALNTWW